MQQLRLKSEVTGVVGGGVTGKTRLVVCNDDGSIRSMTYFMTVHDTSFYVGIEDALFKVSVHGARHGQPGHTRLDYLSNQPETKLGLQRVRPVNGFDMPVKVPGVSVRLGVAHMLRLRIPYWCLNRSGPQPVAPTTKASYTQCRLPLPRLNWAVDIDLYLNAPGQRPWTPRGVAAARDNSLLPPLFAADGSTLTGLILHREMSRFPSPSMPGGPEMSPRRSSDHLRGNVPTLDADGLLWLIEAWLSKEALMEHGQDALARTRERDEEKARNKARREGEAFPELKGN